ncbi:MAG TPA: hypothetical protein VHX61_09415 [Rhizomicrobium sp.]|jgi:hypothetical protein|nr:hypothetical protein [Rhizomicrobium sp.]
MRMGTGLAAVAAAGVLAIYGGSAGASDAQPAPPVPLQLNVAGNDAPPPQSDSALLPAAGSDTDSGDFLADWFARVEQAQASQPHWMTPLVTVTPRLEQEIRYDQYWEARGNGSQLDIFGSGKGLELIPTTTNEVLINPPAYQEKLNVAQPVAGWLDDQFLVVKQRLVSADEQDGNYIVSAFLGVTAPSGYSGFTNGSWIVTPTLAAGRGWGDFDIQATTGVAIPFRYQSTLGTSVATNVAFQYHLFEYFWPEFEVNDTYWANGKERGGKNQVLLTPGLILGRFVIHDRIKAIIGGGYQFAVSPRYVETTEQTPAYNHSAILTARLSF